MSIYSVFTGRRAIAAVLLVSCLTSLGCQGAKEPYPHPYVPHGGMATSKTITVPDAAPLTQSLKVGVCDMMNQAAGPMGCYVVDGQILALQQEPADGSRLADALCAKMVRSNTQCWRIPGETGGAVMWTGAGAANAELMLTGTILSEEFTQCSNRKVLYDWYYATARFWLQRRSDGKVIWTGDVVASVKMLPSPLRRQATYEKAGAERLAVALLGDTSFREAIINGTGGSK